MCVNLILYYSNIISIYVIHTISTFKKPYLK